MNNLRDSATKTVINDLLKINNKITTLEIKMECIDRYPEFYWKQQDVKALVDSLVESRELYVSNDNGVYRTYSSHTVVQPIILTKSRA